jgi:hypothetical protein
VRLGDKIDLLEPGSYFKEVPTTSVMPGRARSFSLSARVDSDRPEAIEAVLRSFVGKGSVEREGHEFVIKAEMDGVSAKDLNRSLLSKLRSVEKKTRLRAEWTSGKTTERYFDYVLKKTIRA